MKTCLSCGSSSVESAKFCSRCGAKLERGLAWNMAILVSLGAGLALILLEVFLVYVVDPGAESSPTEGFPCGMTSSGQRSFPSQRCGFPGFVSASSGGVFAVRRMRPSNPSGSPHRRTARFDGPSVVLAQPRRSPAYPRAVPGYSVAASYACCVLALAAWRCWSFIGPSAWGVGATSADTAARARSGAGRARRRPPPRRRRQARRPSSAAANSHGTPKRRGWFRARPWPLRGAR